MTAFQRFTEFLWDLATWAVPFLLIAIGGLVRKVMTNERVIRDERAARKLEIKAIQASLDARDQRDQRERQEQRERLTRIEARQDETYRTIIAHVASKN